MGKFDKFNKKVEELAKEVRKIQENNGTGEYKETPLGKYEVVIDKMELGITNAGDKPMFKCRFKILTGDHKNSIIFMNQVVTVPFQIHIVNEFLESLNSGVAIEFNDYDDYETLIDSVLGKIEEKYEYGLEYDETDKGFKTFKITDVFENEK